MIKRITAAVVALALGVAISLVGASAAQAHTADLVVAAACNTTSGQYDLTWTLTLDKVPDGETATIKYHTGTTTFSNGWNGSTFTFEGDAGTHFGNGVVTFHTSIPGNTTGNGPWVYVNTTFDKNDTFSIQSDRQATDLTGTCGDTPDSKKITFCHYDGSNDNGGSGKYSLITTSVSAFYTAGHIDHANDIFPAGSVTKKGVTTTWAAQGDQSLLNWPDCIAVNAAAAITVSTPSCQSASVATWTGLLNATGGTIDESVGTHTAVATATNHHKFPASAATAIAVLSADGKTLTITYPIAGATAGSPCWPTNATASVTVTPPTCSTGATAAPGASNWVANVQTSGETTGAGTEVFVFTATSGHKFTAGDGVSADGSTFTISQLLAGPDMSLCPTLVPQPPVVKDLCGTDNDHYGLPTGPAGVAYSRSGLDIVATLTAVNTFWGTLPTGWVLNDNGTATYAFNKTTWTNVDCYPPLKCEVSGTSDTESGDLAPVQGLDGLVFDGPTAVGQAKDIYYRVLSGNAQGISGIGYTVLPGSNGFTAQIVIEVNPNVHLSAHAGVATYATLTAVVSGSGVFTNLENQAIWYSPAILYGDAGGQGNLLTYAALVALMPANTLLSAPSLHLQSNSPADAHSVVSSLTSSCGSFNFGLIHVASTVQHTNQTCDVGSLVGGSITVGLKDHVNYSIKDASTAVVPFDLNGTTGVLAPGTYSVVATADSGYGLDPDVSGSVVISPYSDQCGHVDPSVTPGASPSPQNCNTDAKPAALVNGFITVNVTTGIDYVVKNSANTVIPFDAGTGKTGLLPVGDYTVTPTAQAGFVLSDASVIPLHIAAYFGVDCIQLVDHPLVDPSASHVQLGCRTSGSYTLSNTQDNVNAVVWTVNGSTVVQNTYTVTGPGHYVITAAPGVGYGFDNEQPPQTQWVFDFALPVTCDLATLALTGSTPGGILVLAGFLTLFGLALLRRAVQARKTVRG